MGWTGFGYKFFLVWKYFFFGCPWVFDKCSQIWFFTLYIQVTLQVQIDCPQGYVSFWSAQLQGHKPQEILTCYWVSWVTSKSLFLNVRATQYWWLIAHTGQWNLCGWSKAVLERSSISLLCGLWSHENFMAWLARPEREENQTTCIPSMLILEMFQPWLCVNLLRTYARILPIHAQANGYQKYTHTNECKETVICTRVHTTQHAV